MDQQEINYLEFLRFCLNDHLPAPACIKDINWHKLLEFATRQTIVGLYARTVLMKDGKLTIEGFMGNKPSDEDVMEWVFEDFRLRKDNTRLFERTTKAAEWFAENGFRNVILKGQGNALMYPDPMLRTPGDIDIWLEGGREKVLAFTTKYYQKEANSMHVDFPMFRDTPVEVHFRPTRLFNPYRTKALWAYCDSVGGEQFDNKVTSPDGKYSFSMPTNEFNAFYQLDHVFRHLIYKGIGMRQVIDYFFLLRKRYNDGATPEDNKRLIKLLNRFGIKKFARAMMYVQREVLGLEDKYLFIEPHEREGKFLLKELLESGNFGHHDTRLDDSLEGVEGHMKRFWVLESFRLRLLTHYPSEAIWMPWRDIKRHWEREQEAKEEGQDNTPNKAK